ncbi:MAG TPA: FdhF/YdeP family oxidoreductase [Chryseolinea sp.]|nr:FdhF/YdeP family oxidoreductase [Chryseolinea sp.]
MSKAPGGWSSINYSLKVAGEVGVNNFVQSIRSKNTCKVCAYGMGGQRGGMVNEFGEGLEICKKSIQAQLTDIQPEIEKDFFKKSSIPQLKQLKARELERLGRINYPLYKDHHDTHYKVIDWNEALSKIINAFKKTNPDRSFFYASGRSSNEAAFILHLFARLYGTNNVNNCSYYCHQASGVGIGGMLGSGTATVQLEDLKASDMIFVIGANPSSNHPRFLAELMHCRKRGGKVIIVNPAKEPGLVRFTIPSSVTSMVGGGSTIASAYIQPNIGGDVALLKGIAKVVLEKHAEDKDFLRDHTNGFEAFKQDIDATSWPEIEESSGVDQAEIVEAANWFCEARNVVFTWAMGITHHVHGVDNVESIVNLALLRGMVGRPHAGLLPLRGHSNVQGIGSMGVSPQLKQNVFDAIQDKLGITLPQSPGWDTMSCIKAAYEQKVDLAFILGGNLYGSNPDQHYTEKALDNIPFKIFLSTTLNQGHLFGSRGEGIILPVAARDEERQSTTQESMFNFVRLSDGGIVRLSNVRSETEIITDIAIGVLEEKQISFKKFKDHQNIRAAIAATIPGFETIKSLGETKEEFQIAGRTLHEPLFKTVDAKATMKVVPIPPLQVRSVGKKQFRLMSVRSEGQFNSIVYEEQDVWRGQQERWVVLMNPEDMQSLGLHENDFVSLKSETGIMRNVKVRSFTIKRGNVVGYYPETNVLISTATDKRSLTPSFKNTLVEIE